MENRQELIHGTCVAIGGRGVLLRGHAGAGKSDLALRLIHLSGSDCVLVSDDQVAVEALDGNLVARPPKTIAGRMEVRGIGVVMVPYAEQAPLALIVDLVAPEDVPRLPENPARRTRVLGIECPHICLTAFEPSAPLKVKLALDTFA